MELPTLRRLRSEPNQNRTCLEAARRSRAAVKGTEGEDR
jgi:hypothetical protein